MFVSIQYNGPTALVLQAFFFEIYINACTYYLGERYCEVTALVGDL